MKLENKTNMNKNNSSRAVFTNRQAKRASARSSFTIAIVLILAQILIVVAALWSNMVNSESIMQLQSKISLEQLIKVASVTVSDYVNATANIKNLANQSIESGFFDIESPEKSLKYMDTILNSIPEIDGVMIGRSDERFTFLRKNLGGRFSRVININGNLTDVTTDKTGYSVSESTSNASYKPSKRPWFKKALANPNKTILTDPYIFASSKQAGITIASLIKDSKPPAVIAMDIKLNQISKILEDLKLSKNARAFISDEAGNLIAGSHLGFSGTAVQVMQIKDIRDGILQKILENNNGKLNNAGNFQKFYDNGDSYAVILHEIEIIPGTRWTIGVYAPESDFIAELYSLYTRQLVLILGIALVTACLAWPIALRLAKPMGKLQHQATTDSLTGLGNRASFLANSVEVISRKRKKYIGLIILDLDGFKAVNDNYGHAIGDEVIISVGSRLNSIKNRNEVLSRLGGDEFAMLIQDETLENIIKRAEEIIGAVSKDSISSSMGEHRLGATAGVSFLRDDEKDTSKLLLRADIALVNGKRKGKGLVWLSEEDAAV